MDIKKANYINTIGDAVLSAFWKDPAFDTEEDAFYDVRVLEIPTPRWTTYCDAAFFQVPLSDRVPATTPDSAYASPIFAPHRLPSVGKLPRYGLTTADVLRFTCHESRDD